MYYLKHTYGNRDKNHSTDGLQKIFPDFYVLGNIRVHFYLFIYFVMSKYL